MTANMQDMLDQAFQAGRDAERKMAAIAASGSVTLSAPARAALAEISGNGSRKRVAKAASNPRSSTRGKGVKARIAGMILTAPLTVAEIIAHTGFKKTSVRATLASLKKEGLAIQDGNAWLAAGDAHESGNSEGVAAGA
jgi:predicted Rossmann fold nucleotide-binding protein DprA/Smf involved in DNA uptake